MGILWGYNMSQSGINLVNIKLYAEMCFEQHTELFKKVIQEFEAFNRNMIKKNIKEMLPMFNQS